MRAIHSLWITLAVCVLACAPSARGREASSSTIAPAGGSIIEYDSIVAVREAGPHAGGGATTAYPFFAHVDGLALVFRKRVLHAGAAIGYHRQTEDEIYYVLSGRGEMTLDGVPHEVGPGTAILTRTGSSHGLHQRGSDDLVILINYLRAPEH